MIGLKRRHYQQMCNYLLALRRLYHRLKQAEEWHAFLSQFREQHARKRVLLALIEDMDGAENGTDAPPLH